MSPYTERFQSYAASLGVAPDLAIQTLKSWEFRAWNNSRWAEFRAAKGLSERECTRDGIHEEMDDWLKAKYPRTTGAQP